jgi:hypothetical protein
MDDTMFERLIEVRDDLRLMNNDSGAAAVEWAIVQLVGPPPSAIVDATGWADAAFDEPKMIRIEGWGVIPKSMVVRSFSIDEPGLSQ